MMDLKTNVLYASICLYHFLCVNKSNVKFEYKIIVAHFCTTIVELTCGFVQTCMSPRQDGKVTIPTPHPKIKYGDRNAVFDAWESSVGSVDDARKSLCLIRDETIDPNMVSNHSGISNTENVESFPCKERSVVDLDLTFAI